MRALVSLALHPKRLLALVAGVIGFAAYVWVAAVHAVPGVKERKAAFRTAWRNRERKRPT